MASNYTTNYQLNQWEAGDQVLRTEFNQDNQKIDAALKTNADAIAAETAARAVETGRPPRHPRPQAKAEAARL